MGLVNHTNDGYGPVGNQLADGRRIPIFLCFGSLF